MIVKKGFVFLSLFATDGSSISVRNFDVDPPSRFSLQSDPDTSNSDASERVLCTKQGGVLEESLHVLPCVNVDPDELTVINECLFRVLPQLQYEFDSASHASDLESVKKNKIKQRI